MVAQSSPAVKTIIILSNDQWLRVPPGADPDRYRRQAEARLLPPAQSPQQLALPGLSQEARPWPH